MGQSQVLEFVRHSGGTLLLTSQVGHGTQARMVLPAHAAPAHVPISSAYSTHDAAPLRILMVEDDVLAASVVAPALEAAGHHVQLCSTADEACQVLMAGEQFDVLFTDVVMPGQMSGIDLVRWAQHRVPGMPAVVATGFTSDSLDPDLDVLHKPYDVDSVMRTLRWAVRHVSGKESSQ